jgi:hypothetical protein
MSIYRGLGERFTSDPRRLSGGGRDIEEYRYSRARKGEGDVV